MCDIKTLKHIFPTFNLDSLDYKRLEKLFKKYNTHFISSKLFINSTTSSILKLTSNINEYNMAKFFQNKKINGIIPILDFYKIKTIFCIIYKFQNHFSLSHYLDSHTISYSFYINIITKISSLLSSFKKYNLFYSNLIPENILLHKSNNKLFITFGDLSSFKLGKQFIHNSISYPYITSLFQHIDIPTFMIIQFILFTLFIHPSLKSSLKNKLKSFFSIPSNLDQDVMNTYYSDFYLFIKNNDFKTIPPLILNLLLTIYEYLTFQIDELILPASYFYIINEYKNSI